MSQTKNRYAKITVLISMVVLFVAQTTTVTAVAVPKTFPRKANTYLSWTLTPQQATELAKWDLVVLDMEIQERHPDLLKKMRQLNPDIVILAYITPQEIMIDAKNSYSIMRRKLASGISDEWYLHDNRGNKLSRWPGTYILNVTQFSKRIDGLRYQDYLLNFVQTELLSNGLWDGIFYDNAWDNITYFADTNTIDFDDNGISDTDLDQKWRASMIWIYEQTRLRHGAPILLVGNGLTDVYLDYLDGMLVENFANFDWTYFMDAYKKHAVGENRYNIFNANTKNTGDQNTYQWMRFGIASSLLEDGYFSYDYGDKNHAQTWHYDEYDTNLGTPLNKAFSQNNAQAYQKDIWRRDYDRGVAIVNSSDRDTIIDLGGDFEKIRGTQDPQINDGSIVSEISLVAQDGLLLLKTFQDIKGIPFVNGAFARFLQSDGTRTRNGHFVYDEKYDGGDIIAHMDLNQDATNDFIKVQGNKIIASRDDGQLFFKLYPYGIASKNTLTLAVGDILDTPNKEIIVAPKKGLGPIKMYSIDGILLQDNWYPFGIKHTAGYSIAIDEQNKQLVIASATTGSQVSVYDASLKFIRSFTAFSKNNTGVKVAVGDVFQNGTMSVVAAAAGPAKPLIKIFAEATSTILAQFYAYTSFGFENGISNIGILDTDYDGKDDIVVFTESLGL